jgi:hypothetical protein
MIALAILAETSDTVYKGLSEQLDAPENAAGARYKTEQSLAELERKIGDTQLLISDFQGPIVELQRRLDRNANPRFLHYMQLHRADKVERLSRELVALLGEEAHQVRLKLTCEKSAERLYRALSNIRQSEAQKARLETEQRQLFEQIVASAATPRQDARFEYERFASSQ